MSSYIRQGILIGINNYLQLDQLVYWDMGTYCVFGENISMNLNTIHFDILKKG